MVEDTAAVAAPRQAGLARVRRALSFAPFFRAFVAIEFSFLALAAAIGDEIAGGLDGHAGARHRARAGRGADRGRAAGGDPEPRSGCDERSAASCSPRAAGPPSCAAAVGSLLAQRGRRARRRGGRQRLGAGRAARRRARPCTWREDVGIPGGRNAGVPRGLRRAAVLPRRRRAAAGARTRSRASGRASWSSRTSGCCSCAWRPPAPGVPPRDWVPRLRVGDPARSSDVTAVWEGAVAMPRAVFEQVGGWPAEFRFVHEGIDLAWRVMDTGPARALRRRHRGHCTPSTRPRPHDYSAYTAPATASGSRAATCRCPLGGALRARRSRCGRCRCCALARASCARRRAATATGCAGPCGPRKPLRVQDAVADDAGRAAPVI